MPARPTLRQIDYLVAVAETGSIALAAARLNVSAPTISAAIAQLEEGLGLALFARRHAQGMTPTAAGRQILEAARQVQLAVEALQDRALDLAGGVRGPLAVGCLMTFAQVVLPGLRRGFAARAPEVRVAQSEADHAGLIAGLRQGVLDVALSYALEIPPDLVFEPLLALAPHALLPEDHALAGRESVSAADLAPHPMILLDLPYSAAYFLELFTAEGVAPRIAERTRDMGVMRAMVANGFGFSIANIGLGSDRAPDGRRLCFVPLRTPVAPMRMGLMLPGAAPRRAAVAAFAAHCHATLTAASLPGLAAPAGEGA